MIKKEVAGCVILSKDGKVLLLHRNTEKWQHWEIPGGKLDPGENPQQTARREVYEESGLRVKLIKKLGVGEFSEGDTAFVYHWFLAEIVRGVPTIMERNTFDDVGYFSWEELKKPGMVLSNSLKELMKALLEGIVVL